MTINQILVCDDIEDLAMSWIDEIRSTTGLGDAVVHLAEPAAEFAEILKRIPREGEPAEEADPKTLAFDNADVLVVDYDLFGIGGEGARHTGEEFARMVRLYSDCGFVIVMNQFDEQASFDLEMTGHLSSFADLNIGSHLIGSKPLWGAERSGAEFAPWYWPNISDTITARDELADTLAGHLDDPLLTLLGFPAGMAQHLSDLAAGFISPTAQNPDALEAVTVRDFLTGSTEHKEIVRALQSSPERAAKFAAARLWKWLARAVVGPQDLLVDVPHLIQRLPFLMKSEIGDPADFGTWNKAIGIGAGAIADELQDAKFDGDSRWLGRDAFWWPKIAEHPALPDLRSSFDPDKYADAVFAEDASVFIAFDDATPFRAGFYNQFDVRYLHLFPNVNYAPGRRLAAV